MRTPVRISVAKTQYTVEKLLVENQKVIYQCSHIIYELNTHSTTLPNLQQKVNQSINQSIMKLIIAATLVASTVAFAPAAEHSRSSTAIQADARSPDGLGVDPGPLDFFDPLGLAEDTDSFARRRAVEIKHGRIAMAAFVGMLVQELGVTFPGNMDVAGTTPFSGILDNGMGFPALASVPGLGLAQIALFAGIAETIAMPAGQYTGGPQDLPGGYDGDGVFIPGGYPGSTQIEDPEARDRALNVEIQNGRAAMLGVTGAMMHSCLDSCDHHFFYPITHN